MVSSPPVAPSGAGCEGCRLGEDVLGPGARRQPSTRPGPGLDPHLPPSLAMLTGREAFSTWETERELGSPLLFFLLKLDDQIWGRQKDSDRSRKETVRSQAWLTSPTALF